MAQIQPRHQDSAHASAATKPSHCPLPTTTHTHTHTRHLPRGLRQQSHAPTPAEPGQDHPSPLLRLLSQSTARTMLISVVVCQENLAARGGPRSPLHLLVSSICTPPEFNLGSVPSLIPYTCTRKLTDCSPTLAQHRIAIDILIQLIRFEEQISENEESTRDSGGLERTARARGPAAPAPGPAPGPHDGTGHRVRSSLVHCMAPLRVAAHAASRQAPG